MKPQEAAFPHLEQAVLFVWPALPWIIAAAGIVGLFFIYLEWRAFITTKRQSHRPGRRRRMVWH